MVSFLNLFINLFVFLLQKEYYIFKKYREEFGPY
jgi:hypothetical protein